MNAEIFMVFPAWATIFREIGMTPEAWERLKYENFVEWAYRVDQAVKTTNRVLKEPPPPQEMYEVHNLCYLSHPPAYLCTPEVGKHTCEMLYGKYATVEYVHVDDFSREIYWINGYHNDEGFPVHQWTVAVDEKLCDHFDEEDEKAFLTSNSAWTGGTREELNERLDRMEFTIRERLRDLPKVLWDPPEWGRATWGMIRDFRIDELSRWAYGTLYASCVSTYISSIAQSALMSAEFFTYLYYGLKTTEVLGLDYLLFSYVPMPNMLTEMLTLPQETFVKRMSEFFLGGYNAIHKHACGERKIPLLFRIKKSLFKYGQFYPHYKGIVPPMVMARTIPPSFTTTNVNMFLETPPSKEFWELLESEADADRKTGEIPSVEETSRFKFLLDPSVEPLKPSDFPPIDWNVGQIWPFDITREKMEIMVEEGYDGSGKDIEYYSELADKKMGKRN